MITASNIAERLGMNSNRARRLLRRYGGTNHQPHSRWQFSKAEAEKVMGWLARYIGGRERQGGNDE
jgi:hypothetical protein